MDTLDFGFIEGMNRHILILGNGFDIFLKRPTKYSEYFNAKRSDGSYYCPKGFPAPIIEHLNSQWSETDIENVRWYDLENELLEYYKKYHPRKPNPQNPSEIIEIDNLQDVFSEDELKMIDKLKHGSKFREQIFNDDGIYSPSSCLFDGYQNALDSLVDKKYIKLENNKYSLVNDYYAKDLIVRDRIAFYLIKKSLCEYVKDNAKKYSKRRIKSFFDCFKESPVSDVYSFNYTTIPFDKNVYTFHVHGSCKFNNIILGTREYDFKNEFRFLQKTFDNNYYPANIIGALSNLRDDDMVTFFGHSLGENDRQYFTDFFVNQSIGPNSKRLTVNFIFRSLLDLPKIKRAIQVMTDYHLGDFMAKNTINFYTTNNGIKKVVLTNKDVGESIDDIE